MSEIHSWHFHIPVPDPLGMEAIVRTINLLARNAPRLDLSATQHYAAETRTGIYQSSSSSPGPGLTKLNEYAEEHGAPAFALFTKLPLELRLQVWKEFSSFAVPRDVVITLSQPTSDISRPSFKSATPTPDILRICREAREVGLKKYKTIFNTKDKDHTMKHEIYAEPMLDTILVLIPAWVKQYDWALLGFGHQVLTNNHWSSVTHRLRRVFIEPRSHATGSAESTALLLVDLKSAPKQLSDTISETLEQFGEADVYIKPAIFPTSWDGFWDGLCEKLAGSTAGADTEHDPWGFMQWNV